MASDYYQTLGISKSSDEKEIKSAYRKLARQYHPDVNPGDAAAEETFKRLGEAYEVLGDPKKRAAYDEERARPKVQPQTARPAGGAAGGAAGTTGGRGGPFPDVGGGRDAFSSMMDDLLGAGRRKGAGTKPSGTPPSGAPAGAARPGPSSVPDQSIEVTLEEAFHGATRRHFIDVDEPCLSCRGTGKAQAGRDGLSPGSLCAECRGAGRKKGREEVTAAIPAGVAEGAKLRLRNKGAAARDGQRGDLLLTVHLKKHPVFERDGANLLFDLVVPYTVAALGGDLGADVLGAKKTISIPPGSQCGQKMRLAGQGMPALRDRPAGDLFARLKVFIPKDLNSREQALLRELAQMRQDPVRG